MANTLLLKKSGSADETPSAGELLHGELAINYADGKLFFKNSGNSVVQLLSSPGTGAGQVLFSNGSTMDGDSTFFYDDTNNRLGIGTASPSSNVHIKGSNTPVKLIVEQTTSGEQAILSLNTTNRPWGLIADQSPDILSIGEIGASVGSQMHFSNAGNVGIGLSNPADKLVVHVTGSEKSLHLSRIGSGDHNLMMNVDETVNNRNQILFNAGGAEQGGVGESSSYTFAGISSKITQATGSALKGQLSFYVNTGDTATTALTIHDDASATFASNVGIGETSPDSLLHIKSSAPDFRLEGSPGSADGDVANLLFYHGTNNVAKIRVKRGADAGDGEIEFFTANDSLNTAAMHISQNSKVGIGTTAPDKLLHIFTSDAGAFSPHANTDDMIIENGADAGMTLGTADGGSAGIGFESPSSTSGQNSITWNYNSGAERLRFIVDANETMTLKGAKVGIGNTGPSHKLSITAANEVGASLLQIQRTTGYGAWLQVENNTRSTRFGIDDSHKIHIWEDSSERITITSGNVGIGTTSPGYPLSVSTSTAGRALYVAQTYGSGTAYGAMIEAEGSATTNVGLLCKASGATNNYALIASTGNVGIGIAAPTSELHLNGSNPSFQITDSTVTAKIQSHSSDGLRIATTSNHNMRFQINSATKMTLDTNGNVGIDDTSPSHKLSIRNSAFIHLGYAGTAAATETGRISTNAWDVENTAYSLAEISFVTDAANGYTGGIEFRTNSVNSTNTRAPVRMTLNKTGDLYPNVTNAQDLGSPSKRWANVYAGDLHLKNEQGDWTVVEGEEELYIYNNKTGKKYAFVMREIE